MEGEVTRKNHFVRILSLFFYILFSITFLIWLLVLVITLTDPADRIVNLTNFILMIILVYFTINPFYGMIKIQAWKKKVISGNTRSIEHPWKTLIFVILIFLVITLLFKDEFNNFGGGVWGMFIAIVMSTGTGISSYRSLNFVHSKLFDKKRNTQKIQKIE